VPQLSLSNPTLVQELPQQVPTPPSGAGHGVPAFTAEHVGTVTHAPLLQNWSAAQAMPQAPQWSWLE
jgi:hypothetical protein